MFNRIIVSPHCNRPKYTKQVLEYMGKATGIEDYLVVFSVEPGNQEVLDLVKSVNFAETMVNVNDSKLGCNVNIFKSLYLGFNHTYRPYSILCIEDDILISKDSLLKYEEWAAKLDDSFSYCMYNRVLEKDYQGQYDLMLRRETFVPWGVAYTYKSFMKMIDWNCFGQTTVSWDVAVDEACRKNGRSHAYNFLSRSQNIGAEGGVHVPSAEWHAEHHHLPFWAGDLDARTLNA